MPKNKLTGQSNLNHNSLMKNQSCLDASEPRTWGHFSAACSSKLGQLKNQLVEKFTAEFSDVQAHLVSLAVDEAQALAVLIGVPHLLLPTLAEEKVQGLRNWTAHQQAIYHRPALARAA